MQLGARLEKSCGVWEWTGQIAMRFFLVYNQRGVRVWIGERMEVKELGGRIEAQRS